MKMADLIPNYSDKISHWAIIIFSIAANLFAQTWMQFLNPRNWNYLIILTMSFHFRYLWLIQAGFDVIAEVTDVEHFLFRIPHEGMFSCIFYTLVIEIIFLRNQNKLIEILKKSILLVFRILIFLEIIEWKLLSLMSELVYNFDKIEPKSCGSSFNKFFILLLISFMPEAWNCIQLEFPFLRNQYRIHTERT